jgi:hypothetical protein
VATATKVITIYEIGQKLFGGTVFYADSIGNCLVAADNDLATNFTWGCNDKTTNITKTFPMAGKDNSSKLITQCGNSTAAYTCSQLTSNGYSDWYLPSVDELSLIWDAKNVIGSFDHSYRYLSSTEAAFNSARGVDFVLPPNRTTGIQAILKSDNFFKIRPIRTQFK